MPDDLRGALIKSAVFANPLTLEIERYFGDLSLSEVAWLDAKLTSARNAVIEECAVLAEQQNRTGYEWVRDSLWDSIIKRVPAALRALKRKTA